MAQGDLHAGQQSSLDELEVLSMTPTTVLGVRTRIPYYLNSLNLKP